MVLQIAICDEDKNSGLRLESWLLEYAERERLEFNVKIFDFFDAFMDNLERDVWYDLVLIDIRMPSGQGIEIGRELRHRWGRKSVNIIFISFYRECCCRLFELEPLNVHLKPLQKEKIFQDIAKVIGRGSGNKKIIEYRHDDLIKAVPLNQIIYIKAIEKKLVIQLPDREIRIRDSLNQLEIKLRCSGFCRCHRSYLINMKWVTRYKDRILEMRDGTEIPVGAKYGVTVRDALRWYDSWR